MKFGREDYKIAIWKNEQLGSLIACDTETTIVPFTMTPDLVTCQVYGGGDVVYYVLFIFSSVFLTLRVLESKRWRG